MKEKVWSSLNVGDASCGNDEDDVQGEMVGDE